MKHLDLTRKLLRMGYRIVSTNGPHEKWTNGKATIAVPRHREIGEMLAKKIIRQAQEGCK